MTQEIGILDMIGALGLFVAGFLMWVAWEMITARKLVALLLAISTFVLTWAVAVGVGAGSVWPILALEAVVLAMLLRIGWGGQRG